MADKKLHITQVRSGIGRPETHRRTLRALGIRRDEMVSPHQVHSATVQVVDARDRGRVCEATDALISDTPGVYLMLRFADCVPVLLYDPVRRAVGLAHAGWRGTVACIARETVRRMVDAFGCRPADIRAGIGASIGPCCYEVGPDVARQFAGLDGVVRRGRPQDLVPDLQTEYARHKSWDGITADIEHWRQRLRIASDVKKIVPPPPLFAMMTYTRPCWKL